MGTMNRNKMVPMTRSKHTSLYDLSNKELTPVLVHTKSSAVHIT